MLKSEYSSCFLCSRKCGVNRYQSVGYCNTDAEICVSYYWLHKWEEPSISGSVGSGTVFFDGCSLGCVFCQNASISRVGNGKKLTVSELASVMLELQSVGAHNINFVTPTHFVPSVREAIILAKSLGLKIPIVYNTGSYDSIEALRSLEGLVDVYLPDFKFYTAKSARKYSNAPDYPETAKAAIAEMYRQTGAFEIGQDGLMKKGVIIRILLLPGCVAEAKLSLKQLYDIYGDNVFFSLMNQYTPMPGMSPPLDRRVTAAEYAQLVDYAERIGVTNAYIQEKGTADESFIPPFGSNGSICGIKESSHLCASE